jgi:hypothetical protein
MKKQLVKDIAKQLTSYGYTVYLSSDGRHGFYTDGTRCVSFGGNWNFCVDFSGNYRSKKSGTGWGIAKEKVSIFEDEARDYIQSNAPSWATREHVTYTTPEQHLETYGKTSGYTQFKNDEVQA